MRRRHDPRRVAVGMIGGQRLDIEDIEAGAGDLAALDRLDQGVFVDDGPPRGIDEIGARLHVGQCLGVDGAPAAVRQDQMDRNDIRLAKQIFFTGDETDAVLGASLIGEVLAPGGDIHAEGQPDPGDRRPLAPQADDA